MEENWMKTTMVPKYINVVEPTNFSINRETLNDNQYMGLLPDATEELHQKVLAEHRGFQSALTEHGVQFQVYQQNHPDACDSIFTCDWYATLRNEDFPEGIFFLFPMRWPTRRLERNPSLVETLKKDFKHFVDMTFFEEKDIALESFGATSLDFHNRILYMNISERAHLDAANYFIEQLNKYSVGGQYKLRLINSSDPKDGKECFHSGLYIAFNDKVAFLCKEYVTDQEAESLIEEITSKYPFKYQLILLSAEEVSMMCANVYEVYIPNSGKTGLVMSKLSYEGYSKENLEKLKDLYEFIVVDFTTVNKCAGGSVRCMTNMIF